MSYQSIIQDITNKQLAPVYFLHGEEAFFIDKVMEAANGILPEAEKAFNQVTIYGKEANFKLVVDHAAQYPMMSSHRVVLLKEAQYMSDFDQLLKYFEKPSPQTCLFIGYKKKIDGRKKVFSTLKKTAVVLQSDKIKEYKVAEWISNYVRQKRRLIHPDNAQRLSDLLGNDLSKVINELDKLMVTCPEGNEINEDAIMNNVGLSKDYNIFEFQNAISAKNINKAFAIAEYFGANEKDQPLPMLLGSMYNYFTKVMITKANLTLDNRSLAQKLRVFSPTIAASYKSAAKHYSVDQLKSGFHGLLEADKAFKGVGKRNAKSREILQELLFTLFYGKQISPVNQEF